MYYLREKCPISYNNMSKNRKNRLFSNIPLDGNALENTGIS